METQMNNRNSFPEEYIEKNLIDEKEEQNFETKNKYNEPLPNSQTFIICSEGIIFFQENLRLAGSLNYIPIDFQKYEEKELVPILKQNKMRFKCLPAVSKYQDVLNEKQLRLNVLKGDINRARQLLDKGTNPSCADNKGRTPLHLAASKGNVEIVKLLLRKKANPNSVDCLGNTPLHLAACTNHISIVTLLLLAGTDLKIVDRYGSSPLNLATSKLKLLQKDSTSSVSYLKEQILQIIDMMKAYLERTCNVNSYLLDQFQNVLTVKRNKNEIDADVNKLLVALSEMKLQTVDNSKTSSNIMSSQIS